ncbi:MAG: hypothetical protein PHC84_00045 [Clostridia bacterium]|nr:hypothetical protein [Clostridia bacterium]
MNRVKRWLSIKKNKNARLFLLLGLVLFNLALWLISSFIAYLISPADYGGNVFAAFWRSGITWMMDPGFYAVDGNVGLRLLSIAVIVTSMISFSGGIIAYVASLFSSIIENAEKGKDKLYVFNHVLILNWNSKALELIADYLYDDSVNNVVILSACDKNEVEKMISRKLYGIQKEKNAKLNVIVKEGDVFSKSDLNDVCIDNSHSIIILAPIGEEDDDAADMSVIKTLMLVANCEQNKNQTIILETKKDDTAQLVREKISKTLGIEGRIFPILPDEMMGKLIAQTLLYSEVNDVYQELFSFKGAEFYTLPEGNISEFMQTHNKGIPIYNLNGAMYVLGKNAQDLASVRKEPLGELRKLTLGDTGLYKDKNIVIFGKNNKLRYIVESLNLYEKDSGCKVNLTFVASNDAETIQKSIKDIRKIDSILILSSDKLDKKDYDSDVLLTLLMIQDTAKLHKSDIIIELLESKHYDIAQGYNIKNTIISNKYISRIMTQISKDKRLYDIFQDLLSYDTCNGTKITYEVYTFLAADFLCEKLPMLFSSQSELVVSCYLSSNGKYTVIGHVKEGKTRVFQGDLDKTEELVIQPNDKLIVICQ